MRTPTLRTLVVLASLASAPALAQKTLDERIRQAQDAQIAREAAERLKAEALRPVPALSPHPAMGMPTVVIGPDAARFAPTTATSTNASQRTDRFELLQIVGFPDEAQGLEATLGAGGMRIAVTRGQPQLPDGWKVLSITADAVELARGSERQVLRYGTAQTPTAPGAQAERRPVTGK